MIGIIGTAGRGEDAYRLFERSFIKMGEIVHEIVTQRLQVQCTDIDLISGGAAWADHIAVHNFLTGCGKTLTLALPCEWDSVSVQYTDNGSDDWRINPGRTANRMHRSFGLRCGFNSLHEIDTAIKNPNCKVNVGKGFHDRNTYIAEQCFALIAFTFGDGPTLKDGGTADTMRKFLSKNLSGAFHVDLNTWKVYDNLVVP